MSDWLDSYQGLSGQYKVLEKVSQIKTLLGSKIVFYIYYNKTIYGLFKSLSFTELVSSQKIGILNSTSFNFIVIHWMMCKHKLGSP